jgi:hypothetical protein
MVANHPDPRDAILVRFEDGKISKQQADAEARAAGFESMEVIPDFANIDCFELPHWTMPLLMAIVIDGRSKAVVTLSEEFRRQTRIWHKEDVFNARGEKCGIDWRLRPPDKLSLYDVVAEAVSRENSEGRTPRAVRLREELGAKFLQGVLTAYGKKPGDYEHSPIPKTAWATIDLFDQPCNRFEPEDIGCESEETPRYSDVYLIPKEVISAWPQIGAQSEEAQTPVEKPIAPTKPEELTRALLRRFPDGRPSLSLPDLRKVLQEEFGAEIGSFSERSVRRAARGAWPGTSRRGQRSGKSAKTAN